MPYTADTFTNYGISSVAGGAAGRGTPLQAADTTCYLPTGDGATKFPAATPFNVVIGPTEIAKCTTIAGDVLTLLRGQEGTTAATYAVSTSLQLVVSAASLTDVWTAINSGRDYLAADYGAKGDGVTDNTTAIQNAINAANAAGGGTVRLGAGTFITQTLTIYSNITLAGAGRTATVLQLKAGTNADLIWGGSSNAALINVTNQTSGNGDNGGLLGWCVRDMKLGGAKGSQTGGPSYCIRVYGSNFLLENLIVANGYSGGILVDWNGGTLPSDSCEAFMVNCKVRDCGGMGVTWGGPHDSQMSDCVIFRSAQHNLYIGPHAEGFAWSNCHTWGLSTGMVQVLCEGNVCSFVDGEIESSDTVQIVLLGNLCNVVGTQIYGSDAHPASAIQIGQQAGLTPYVNSAFQSAGLTTACAVYGTSVDCTISHCSGSNGAIWYANEFTGSNVRASVWLPSAGSGYSGTLGANSNLDLMVGGLATQYPIRISGGMQAYGGPITVATPATSGTITTAGVTVSRVNPAAAITGVILQAGSVNGQVVYVVNESAFSVTFAAAATSHVADGTSDVIAATTARGFVWDTTKALWYRLA